MQKKKVIYVYDAHCSWCYAFSGEMQKLQRQYNEQVDFEVISGGMVVGDRVGLIKNAINPKNLLGIYARIEEMTGTKFGEEYLAKVKTGDVYVNSEIPAIALSVFKSYHPTKTVDFAHSVQHQLFIKANSVNDEAMYSALAEEYRIDAGDFLAKMKEEKYTDAARYDFVLGRQLKVSGYPQVLVQVDETQFYLIAKGYTNFESLSGRLENVLGM